MRIKRGTVTLQKSWWFHLWWAALLHKRQHHTNPLLQSNEENCLVKAQAAGPQPYSCWFPGSRLGPQILHFWQIPRWCPLERASLPKTLKEPEGPPSPPCQASERNCDLGLSEGLTQVLFPETSLPPLALQPHSTHSSENILREQEGREGGRKGKGKGREETTSNN